jgi:hypothetical protein
MLAASELRKALSRMPEHRYSFAYGSGVMKQLGYKDKDQPMVDFVMAVDKPKQWHTDNLAQNRDHYSGIMAACGPSMIERVQKLGSAIYYHPMVNVSFWGNRQIKYGVISTAALKNDLAEWTTLYTSGRMHKPHVVIQDDDEIEKLCKLNLKHAVCAALILLPPVFTPRELFLRVASLSYGGDVRMGVGEHPQKVSNIVDANLPGFLLHHQAALQELAAEGLIYGHDGAKFGDPSNGNSKRTSSSSSSSSSAAEEGSDFLLAAVSSPSDNLGVLRWEQRISVEGQLSLVHRLPFSLQSDLQVTVREHLSSDFIASPTATSNPSAACHTIATVAQRDAISAGLEQTLAAKVRKTSAVQTMKGLLTAGPGRSVAYVAAKVQKAMAG